MNETPFVVMIGTQSSGSSAIAGVAYHVGVWQGNDLGGRYGVDPDNQCGFEDGKLGRVMQQHTTPLINCVRQPKLLEARLRHRIAELTREANQRGQIPGTKRPRFSVIGDTFIKILGDRLRVIDCHRPLADSIASLQRIQPRQPNAAVQQWLWNGKQRFLAAIPAEHQLRVEYYKLLQDPLTEAQRIAAWLGLTPTREQFTRAVQFIHPTMQHVGSP